jgi:hypothetical protein
VNIVRGIGKIFKFSVNTDNVSEWINLYVLVYYGVSAANGAGDVIFEEGYSISAERVAREIVAEKSKKIRKRKKRSRIF